MTRTDASRDPLRHLLEEARATPAARERVMPRRADAAAGPGLADSERGLSGSAVAYRRAEPYLAASSTLMSSVAGFTLLGYGLDRWMGHTVQWLLVTGAVIGIAVGFIGFFSQVLRADAAAKRLRS
jgi:ATP synthase protein I